MFLCGKKTKGWAYYSELSVMLHIINGIDNFLTEPGISKDHRFAIVTNNAAFASDRVLSRLALIKEGFNLVKIFSPEHGISVKGEDGAFQHHSIDIKTNLPIISLYGDRLRPTAEDLDNIEIVLFDIPDVGCRFLHLFMDHDLCNGGLCGIWKKIYCTRPAKSC